jgi:hypothetical protein
LAVSAGRGILRSGLNVGVSLGQSGGTAQDTLNISNPVARGVLGKEPVESYQKRYSGLTKAGQEKGLGKAAPALAFLGTGLNVAGDVTGFGGAEKAAGKELTEAALKELGKATTEQAVKQGLKKLGVRATPELVAAIKNTPDTHVIDNLIKGGGSKIPQEVSVNIPPPTKNVISDFKKPEVNPEVAQLDESIKIQEQLKKHAPSEIAAKRHDKAIYSMIKQRAEINAKAPGMLPKPAPAQVGQDIVSATVPKATPTPTDPFEAILGAVHGEPGKKGLAAKSVEQQKLLSQERGARFTKSAEAGKNAPGSQGYFAEKGALKGEYSKVNFEPLVHDIGPDRAEELFTGARTKINSTPDEIYHELGLHPQAARLNTQTAVRKVLGLEPGLPTKSELKLLSIYSPKLAEEAKASIPMGRKIFDAASTLFGNARSIKSSLDLSMGGRQGLFVAARHPVEWTKANIESIKFAKNEKYYNDTMRAVHGDEWGKFIDGYNPSVLTGGASHEEAFTATDLSGKIPGVRRSERAYTGGLTVLRKPLIVKAMKAYGNTPEEVEKVLGQKGVQGLIEAVSTLTGRGGKVGGFVSKHATTLQEALFSPRLWASRLQPLNPAFWKRIGPAGRKEAMQSLGSFAAVAGLVLGAAVANGAEVETDPRSSDFLKIKVGDTRYDILGGFQQNIVFGARQLSGSTKSSTSGRVTKFGEGFGAPTRLTSAFDLVRNKANPVLAAGANILEGKDKAGNKINPATEIGQMFVPINIQNAFNARQNPKDVLKGLPDVVGIGSQTYGLKDINISAKQKETVGKLKDKNQQEAYTRFYQTVKVGPDRNKASGDIKKALQSNDVEKAKSIAKDYNQKYADSFKDWKKQYGKYGDKTLTKEYNSNKITGETLKRYITAIKKGETL